MLKERKKLYNLVTFVMSPYRNHAEAHTYYSDDGFCDTCRQTSETALKYLEWKLQQQGEIIDAVYAFVSDDVQAGFSDFCELFAGASYPIHNVVLENNGSLKGALPSIIRMFDFVKQYMQTHQDDEVRMHVDMTGGPRHASMIMLALLQMLQYQGIKGGMVLYTDFSAHKVEIATELMGMFTLISGAEEFTSYGRAEQLKQYFSRQPSLSHTLQRLLQCMEKVSETIRVCGSYETMEKELATLEGTITNYEKAMQQNEEVTEQDKLFCKLLPQIKKEYQPILSQDVHKANPADIIVWCAKRQFLQQAVTFYTEWLPRYLVQKQLITVLDTDMIKECKAHGQLWSSWEIYFFKNYIPDEIRQQQLENRASSLSYKILNGWVQAYLSGRMRFTQLKEKLAGKNKLVDVLLEHTAAFEKKMNRSPFQNAQNFMSLPSDTVLYQIVSDACPAQVKLMDFLQKRFYNARSFGELVCKAMMGISKDKAIRLLQLDETQEEQGKSKEQLAQLRFDVFQWLFQHQKIQSVLPQQQVCQFVQTYTNYVDLWRNTFNHAGSMNASRESNDAICHAITDSIAFLTNAGKKG